MATLFVDCYHSLVEARPPASRESASGWQPNLDVVAAIERWHARGAGAIVLWSERGADDAETWRRRVLPHLAGIECLARDARIPRVGDVLIDATGINAKGTRYAPAQSFMIAAS